MEYRFSLTPRLIALALFSGVALLILLFTLGFQIGQRTAKPAPVPSSFATYGVDANDHGTAVAHPTARTVSDFAAASAVSARSVADQALAAPKVSP
jgi:hypothetical protein